jgi:DNA repair exonuclease SbcCD nuclease subunit
MKTQEKGPTETSGEREPAIGHISDIHLGRPTPGDPNGAERLNSLRQALARLGEQSVNAIVVAGDLFDSPQIDAAIVQASARFFDGVRNAEGMPIPVVVIAGNHDPAEEIGLWTSFTQALSLDSVVKVVLKPEAHVLCNGALVVEAYPCETRFSAEPPWIQKLAIPSGAERAVRIVVAHGTLQGGPVPEGESDAYPFTEADLTALDAEYVALGHFHSVYPSWTGNTVDRRYCYSGTHETDQFGADAGWIILAKLSPGKPARIRRLLVGRRCWHHVDVNGPADLGRIEQLRANVESDLQPSRYVIRLRVGPNTRLSLSDVEKLEQLQAALEAVGAQVKRQGDFQPTVHVDSLDISGLPSGAVKEALLALKEQHAYERDECRRAVLEAALLLGWNQFNHAK